MKITTGYPNYSEITGIHPPADLNKWMAALKQIYVKINLGTERKDAINQTINNWNNIEKRDFLDWVKYYESEDIYKYKMAQQAYYVNDNNHYFLPNPPNKIPSPIRSINDQILNTPQEASNIVQQRPAELDANEKRKIVEEYRKKLIGRLNAAEKLLTSQQGHLFAGTEFEKLLNAIYDLKRQILLVNKISTSMQTAVDLIIRQANILNAQGFKNAAQFMVKLAQSTPGDFNVQFGEIPVAGSQPQGQGALANNPMSLEDLTATPPPEMKGKDEGPKDGLAGFMENIEGGGITIFDDEDKDKNQADDPKDEVDMDDEILLDQEIIPNANELMVEAQAVLPGRPITPKPRPDNIEVEDLKNIEQEKPVSKNDVDTVIDTAFANLTVNDIITKLEDIANIFRNREISRQLALVDMMMARLGIAHFFPQYSEVINKNLDAAQYSLTRMDDVLSKLKGSVQTKEIDLGEKGKGPAPGAADLARSLEQADQKEKARKDMKKQLETQQMEERLKPTPEIEQPATELAEAPAKIEPAFPTPRPQPATPAPAI